MVKVGMFKQSGTLFISIPKELAILENIKPKDRLLFNRPAKGRLELLKL